MHGGKEFMLQKRVVPGQRIPFFAEIPSSELITFTSNPEIMKNFRARAGIPAEA